MKILVVVDGDNSEPIAYSNKIDMSIEAEVRAVINQLAIIKPDCYISQDEMVADIVSEIDHGRAHWIDDKWCFDIITID